MRIALVASATLFGLGCGGSSPVEKPTEKTAVAEAPVGALKGLAKALESPKAAERKKAAEEIARIGPPGRPLQQALKQAINKETDGGVKAALTTALQKTGG